jgi:hypothetical protein
MKPWSLFALLSLTLSACQTQPPLNPPARPLNQAGQLGQLSSATAQAPQLKASFLKELELADEEGNFSDEQSSARYDEKLVSQVIGISYILNHQRYFSVQDDGKSSVEAILAHDGHQQAASWVRRWASTLGENALWPDKQSTTYQGPWPALEHAELKRSGGWFMFRSASSKADEYYQRAKDAYKKNLPPDHPEQAEAWAWLGRTSHFLQDMTVPFHTVSMLRPSQLLYHNAYEKTCDQLFWNYLPSRNFNPGGVWVHGPYPAEGAWGIYFNPGMSAAAMIRQNADFARKFYKHVNEAEDWGKSNWERTRAVMIPLGAKTTAGLVVSFLKDLGLAS